MKKKEAEEGMGRKEGEGVEKGRERKARKGQVSERTWRKWNTSALLGGT